MADIYTKEQLSAFSHEQLVDKFLNMQSEAEEFRLSSKELEDFLEQDLNKAQKDVKLKDSKIFSLETELEQIRERFEEQKKDLLKTESQLRTKLQATEEERDKQRTRIRELEQMNDDLERADRNKEQEVVDLMKKLDQAIERTALLETELADGQTASEEMYRLREELKERPRQIVGPMRMETNEDTPEEPTPDGKKEVVREASVARVEPVQVMPESPVKEAAVAKTAQPTLNESKGFVKCVNTIVEDLMVKVNRLEGILTGLKFQSARSH